MVEAMTSFFGFKGQGKNDKWQNIRQDKHIIKTWEAVMKHFAPQDHYDKREDLGNCFETAQEEDPENLLLGFLKEFGDGFDLG